MKYNEIDGEKAAVLAQATKHRCNGCGFFSMTVEAVATMCDKAVESGNPEDDTYFLVHGFYCGHGPGKPMPISETRCRCGDYRGGGRWIGPTTIEDPDNGTLCAGCFERIDGIKQYGHAGGCAVMLAGMG
jgi:hypothetical protein